MVSGNKEKTFSDKLREYNSIIFISNCSNNSIRLIINGVVRLVHTKSSNISGGGFKITLMGKDSQFFDIHARQTKIS
jgi:hypothetical protein